MHQRNRGLSAARNVGLDHTSGEFVLFVDSDDVAERTYAEVLHHAITTMGTPCVACGYGDVAADCGEARHRPSAEPAVVPARECVSRVVVSTDAKLGKMPIAAWKRICRRSLFDDATLRFPEGEVYEDLSALVPILYASGRIGVIPDILYHKRSRLESITYSISVSNLRDYEISVNRFVMSVKMYYPDFAAAADRYMERGLIANAIR